MLLGGTKTFRVYLRLTQSQHVRSCSSLSSIRRARSIDNESGDDRVENGRALLYLDGGGFATKSTPFSMFPLRPLIAAAINFFSCSLALPRMLMAFSAPEGCDRLVSKVWKWGEGRCTPSSTGTEKKSQPVSLAMASPPATPGR